MRISVRSRSDHFHVVFYAREILWLKIYPFLKQSVPYGNLKRSAALQLCVKPILYKGTVRAPIPAHTLTFLGCEINSRLYPAITSCDVVASR